MYVFLIHNIYVFCVYLLMSGFDYGMNAQTDLFELWPSDGYVNGLRGNLPLGIVAVGKETYISTNGCKVGTCDVEGYTGSCFEPNDVFKGYV